MKLFYCDEFVLPLQPGHRFPMEKYRLLRERLMASATSERDAWIVPPAATFAQLCGAHSPDYIERVERGGLTSAEIRAIGFPWTPEMVERSKRSAGATIAAARACLRDGVFGKKHISKRRGAAEQHFNDRKPRADFDKIFVYTRPLNREDGLTQPSFQRQAVAHAAQQRMRHVRVGVDEAGNDDGVGGINRLSCRPPFG